VKFEAAGRKARRLLKKGMHRPKREPSVYFCSIRKRTTSRLWIYAKVGNTFQAPDTRIELEQLNGGFRTEN
jgi:hypothetical protein